MISRVANHCFWMVRYLERADTMARLLDTNLTYVLDYDLSATERWEPLLLASGTDVAFRKAHGMKAVVDDDLVQGFLTWDASHPDSIFGALHRVRENARTIRETISLEMWEAINELWVWFDSPKARKVFAQDPHALYERVRGQCSLFHGVSHDTMLHEEAFEFMRLGLSIERAIQTARILDVKHHRVGPTLAPAESSADAAQWLGLLRSCSGIEPFLKRSANRLNGRAVASFMIFDPAFPRSIQHNLGRASNFLELLCEGRPKRIGQAAARSIQATRTWLAREDIESVVDKGLHKTLDRIVTEVQESAKAIDTEFFGGISA